MRGALLPEPVDHGAFEAFEADRPELQDVGNVIGCRERVRISQADQHAMLRAPDQRDPGLEHDRARPLAANQRARHVEPVLGQKLVEVVAGHASRDAGDPLANPTGMSLDQRAQLRIDRSTPSALVDDGVDGRGFRRAHGESRPVVQQNRQLFDVVDGLAGEQRMRPARVVADHAAERAAAVGRRIRAEGEAMGLGGVA